MPRSLAGLVYLALALAWWVATASAYTVSIAAPSSTSPSDVIEVDVILNSEGELLYGCAVSVYFVPAALSPDEFASHLNPDLPRAFGSGTLRLYPDHWYIGVFDDVPRIIDDSIATLVFHVMDLPGSSFTSLIPVVEMLLGPGFVNYAGQTQAVGAAIHVVPEPVSPLLLASGAALLALAGRRRRRHRAA